jgi:hypothetical protein
MTWKWMRRVGSEIVSWNEKSKRDLLFRYLSCQTVRLFRNESSENYDLASG